jgi:PEGA domain
VTITSEPSGARVEINAIPAGVTPVTVQISPVGLGFTITVSKSGFMKWTVQSFSTAHPYSLHAQLRVNPR